MKKSIHLQTWKHAVFIYKVMKKLFLSQRLMWRFQCSRRDVREAVSEACVSPQQLCVE